MKEVFLMIVRPLAFAMFTAVALSTLLACSGAATSVPDGDKKDDKDDGEIVTAPKKDTAKKGKATPAVDPTDDPTPAPKKTEACALKQVDFGTGACGTCVNASCCDEWTACENNKDCLPLFVCAQKCAGDQACIKDCIAMYPTGGNPLVAATKCVTAQCDAKCK